MSKLNRKIMSIITNYKNTFFHGGQQSRLFLSVNFFNLSFKRNNSHPQSTLCLCIFKREFKTWESDYSCELAERKTLYACHNDSNYLLIVFLPRSQKKIYIFFFINEPRFWFTDEKCNNKPQNIQVKRKASNPT